jgi:hypothetical protein
VSIIQNCERFKIPLLIVRSKADIDIKNSMVDDGYDENDNVSEDEFDDYQARARQSLIVSTKNSVKKNLEEARLVKRDVFIVSKSVIFSLVTAKRLGRKMTTIAIDEARLLETILKTALARRYGKQEPVIKNHHLLTNSSSLALIMQPPGIENHLLTNSSPLALITYDSDSE